jgi:hypothetical protein
MSGTPGAVARRGDLVVICLRDRDWKAGEPLGDDEFRLGQVTSVTRAGLVRLYRPAGTFATAACHTWPGHEGHVCGYRALAGVKAALRPHLFDRPGWRLLREAAGAWEAARREAGPLLSAAAGARGEEFTRLAGRYDAAVTAANSAYRELHEQAARTGSAAA